MDPDEVRAPSAEEVAEIVRRACREAAIAAYEDAGIRGLCESGRWEVAIGAIDALDLHAIVARSAARSGPQG